MQINFEAASRVAPLSGPATAQGAEPALLGAVLDILDDAKAEDVVAIDLRGKSPLGDHMVVASGRSQRHVGAVADQLVKKLKDHGLGRVRVEGMPQCDWVLIDAGDVIVHVFRPEARSFYNLEKMWSADRPEALIAV
jgi:ribosome-associated protein